MDVVPTPGGKAVKEMLSSVSPKGQITIPVEIRRMMGVKPKDKVAFQLEGDQIKIAPARCLLDESYQAIPALQPARSWKEIEQLAAEEQAQEAAGEGLQR